MEHRQARLESRKRGAASRDVQVGPLNIENKSPAKPKLLESALVNYENLPRLRRSTMERPPTDSDGPGDGPGGVQDDVDYVEDLLQDDPEEKSRKSKRPAQLAFYSDDESTPVREASVPIAVPPPKRKRGRPRKVLSESERRFLEDQSHQPKRSRGRPKKGQEVQRMPALFGYVAAAPKKKKHRRLVYEPVVKAAPLTQTKPRGGHRPLTVEMERLVTDSNKDRRHKINTLDVLKHLIVSFEPEPTPTESINADIAHEEFRTHLMNHLGHLFDVHGSIDDLTHEINKISKQKDELRSQIFELRRDHAAVGNELNGLRRNFRSSKQNYEEFNVLAQGLARLQHEVTSDGPVPSDLKAELGMAVRAVGAIYDPISGLRQKLAKVNSTLTAVDNELK